MLYLKNHSQLSYVNGTLDLGISFVKVENRKSINVVFKMQANVEYKKWWIIYEIACMALLTCIDNNFLLSHNLLILGIFIFMYVIIDFEILKRKYWKLAIVSLGASIKYCY